MALRVVYLLVKVGKRSVEAMNIILRQFRAAFPGLWQQAQTNRDDFSRRAGLAVTDGPNRSRSAGLSAGQRLPRQAFAEQFAV